MTLIVNEIFYSIQGESLDAGLPCVFVRLTGCNLRCSYCDTQYAYSEGIPMTIDVILDRVASYSCPLIEITGGEPLIQAETPRLIDCLIEKGYEVLLETNGSLDIGPINRRCTKIVDIKCPSSGEHDKNNLANLFRLGSNDQLKFVIGNEADYRFARDMLKQLDSAFPMRHVLFSPVYGKLRPAKLAAWIQKDGLGVRLHLQLHKVIWPETEKGR